jgi:hypothetical protein
VASSLASLRSAAPLELFAPLGAPAPLEAFAALVGPVGRRGVAQVDRLDRRGIGRAEEQRHGANPRRARREADGEEHRHAPPPGAAPREGALMIVAVDTRHGPTKVGARGEAAMRRT